VDYDRPEQQDRAPRSVTKPPRTDKSRRRPTARTFPQIPAQAPDRPGAPPQPAFSTSHLEHLRDRFDRRPLGLLLIGMPGIDKRLSRYPQLYSRIGFAHQYRRLGDDELAFVLSRHWRKLGLTLDLTDFTGAQAVAAVGRITRGNFRLVHRLFVQIERVLRINDLTVITSDVIEAARSTLVIGDT